MRGGGNHPGQPWGGDWREGERRKHAGRKEEGKKESAANGGDQQEATTAAVSIGMLAFGGVGHRRIMARAFSRWRIKLSD